jgi:TRAF-interacting protein
MIGKVELLTYYFVQLSGDICFSGGLLGPDGSNRYLGKWCKRGPSNGSLVKQGSNTGNLIAVGADGRGGRVKVLRSLNQSSLVGSCTHFFRSIYFCIVIETPILFQFNGNYSCEWIC